MFGATWGEETFEIPHSETDWLTLAQSSEWEPDWVSGAPTPPEEPKEHECLKPGPSPRAVALQPTRVDGGLPPRMAAPKLDLDETMELLSRVLGAGGEDPDLSALSAALKTKSGLSDLEKPPSSMSPGVELLTRDVKSCKGIHSSPMDTCPSCFHPRVRTVPVCSVGDTTEAEMKGYGLAALAPLAAVYPLPPSGGTGDTGAPVRGPKAIATANLQIELPEFDPKKLLKSFLSFCSSWVSNTLMSGPNTRTSKRRPKMNSFSGRLRPLSGRAPTGATSWKDRSKCIQSTKQT